MPVLKETAEAVILPFRVGAWKASDRLGRLMAVVPAAAIGMQLVDAVVKGFGKPGFFEGLMGPLGVEATPADASTAQRVGELTIAAVSLPYDTSELATNLVGEAGSVVADIPNLGWVERGGEVAENVLGAGVAAGLTGLALNLGAPNKRATAQE